MIFWTVLGQIVGMYTLFRRCSIRVRLQPSTSLCKIVQVDALIVSSRFRCLSIGMDVDKDHYYLHHCIHSERRSRLEGIHLAADVSTVSR